MTKLVTKAFSKHIVDQFVESFTEPANSVYYLAASKHTPYDINTSGGSDDYPPTPGDSVQQTQLDPYNNIVFGKKISSSDISLMVPRYNWTTGTTYTQYDNNDANLFSKPFYVVSSSGAEYFVYKCLENNGDNPSTVDPISSTSEAACNHITTGDNYKWKLMYKLSKAQFEKFATDAYIPVEFSSNVSSNAISGSIDTVKVEYGARNWISSYNNVFGADDIATSIPNGQGTQLTYRLGTDASTSSDFYQDSALYISSGTGAGQQRKILSYEAVTRIVEIDSPFDVTPSVGSAYLIAPYVTITGDGDGATGYATVASNSTVSNYIYNVLITNRGSNYTYASALVTGNTGGDSYPQLNTVVTPIIPPIGGHGYRTIQELGSDSIGISVTFANNESGFVSVSNDYRQTLILKDPLFDGVTLTLSSTTGTFQTGETINQISYATLVGTVVCSAASTTITGTGTEFLSAFKSGDQILLSDTISSSKCLRTVDTVTSNTILNLTENPSFTRATGLYVNVAKATVLATGTKVGNTGNYITMSNTEAKFYTGKPVIGSISGYYGANVTSIDIKGRNFNNWSTFDNRTRISYTANTLAFVEDGVVYQTDTSLSNAYFHSANDSFVFLSDDRGPINADPFTPIVQLGSSAQYIPGSVKYTPDIVRLSGEVAYIENYSPITRSDNQSETFRLVLKF